MPDYIDRIEPDPDGLDFDALKKAGISMLQELCGERWTDYNLHDPGVTILEQLCYGLTDLAYRSDFAPEDYLAGPFGKIDFARHALHQADVILPSQVLTADDYRKIIYDSVPEIEDVWLTSADCVDNAAGPAHAGLYRISLKIRESLQTDIGSDEQAELEVRTKQRVIEVFNAHRNLCEDIDEVVVIGTQPVFLCGDIQIHSLRDSAAIFADIFFRCARQVVSGFRTERYLDARDGGISLENMFSGPRTVHGRILSTGADMPGAPIPMARLISVVQSVDGVTHVQRLALCDGSGQPVQGESMDGKVLRLRFPDKEQSTFLRLHFASSGVGDFDARSAAQITQLQTEKAQIVLDDARIVLRKVRFEFDTVRNTVQSLEQIVPAPQGVQRALHEYYSIQHQFPAIYGINRYGVPSSAPLINKVSAHQLKAYLFVAEQLMANYLESLQAIPQVFSVDDLAQTYFSQVIDNQALPDIETLYVDAPPHIGAMLARIVARIDKPEERRSRLIDLLLAMYGEEFSQKSLRRFNYYEDRHSARWLVDNKLAFLKNITVLSRDRATASDYTRGTTRSDGSANRPGLHAKIAILLDLPPALENGEVSRELLHYKLRLSTAALSSAEYERAAAHLMRLAESADDYGRRAAPNGEIPGEVLPTSLLTQGVRLENYILEQNDGAVHVHFQTHDSRLGVVRLGNYAGMTDADHQVQLLRGFIRRLNMASEGVFLVEHLLLRPRTHVANGANEANDADKPTGDVPADFYSSRISVIFPGWSARFSDPDFRALAQETVCRNLPAHLYPEFYWLDFVSMRDFEHRHRIWLDCLRKVAADARSGPDSLNTASASLRKFLLRHRSVSDLTYWV
ncbi:hypothetical protein SAMN04515620_11122 [Collimonas sp. OK607]|uniref:hypothetical protein n=1 Tax=Collimonas sp. OK607 TaxID=1798194 RepID=UPI0008E62376|nr:hypothetical protein [Collimonas sp. OK607]SFA98818.1 hypothetical protein SAMN04515620_11122 [Collimonas sp. OK607]